MTPCVRGVADGHPVLRWGPLWLLLPLLMAAGFPDYIQERTFPEPDAYRTPLSDSLFESNQWRTPPEKGNNWRLTPPPPAQWRTPGPTQSEARSPKRVIELFPKYQPGRPTDFDYESGEEKPQIRVFEFGTK